MKTSTLARSFVNSWWIKKWWIKKLNKLKYEFMITVLELEVREN